MRDLRAAFGTTAALAIALAACGSGPEKRVVDQYFNAVKQQDNTTLSSFAAVKFDKKVDAWRIKDATPEERSPAPLPELVKKMKDLDKELADNKKAAGTYALDHYADIEKVKELKAKGSSIPAKLQGVAAEWDKYNQRDRDLKKAVAEAKEAVEKEKRSVALSVGEVGDIESLQGDMVTKKVNLALTVDGQPQDYVMTLRKYDMKKEAGGQRQVSRWVVHTLTPAT